MSAMPSDAVAVWHMNDESDAAGTSPLTAHGAVELGVSLEGEEREASLARGGDGTVARLSGGYLTLTDDADLDLGDGPFSIAIRMRDTDGTWQYPILGSYGSDTEVCIALRALDGRAVAKEASPYSLHAWMFRDGGPRSIPGNQGMIELVWGAEEPNPLRYGRANLAEGPDAEPRSLRADIRDAVMRTCFPVGLIGPTDWHDIVVSSTGAKLELWIDGVLVDEEYTLGVTRKRTLPFLIGAAHENGELKAGFNGLIDHVAVWNRALTPEEIVDLSGGGEHVRTRELAILGDESRRFQYFRARGHNRKAGDCIPYWDAQTGKFRLFYLILRRNHHSKWDGGHGGLEIWQTTTKDLRTWEHHPVTVPVTEQWEAWNGTGGVAFHNGTYYWFYPCPDYDTDHGGIHLATSADGVNFEKTEPHPFIVGGDCEIYEDDDGLFHMLKAGPRSADGTKDTLQRLTSSDLLEWTPVAEPFIETVVPAISMCPNLFRLGEWYYFIGGNCWFRSRNEFGPWEFHEPRQLCRLSVPKTGAFGPDRRIYAGFLSDNGWGGNEVLREMVQDDDGWLGLRFVPEVIPECGEEIPVESDTVRLDSAEAVVPNVRGDCRIALEVTPDSSVGAIGLELRAGPGNADGCLLTLNPGEGTVAFSKLTESAGNITGGPVIDTVRNLDKPFTLDIICRHDIIDVEVAGFRATCTRFWNPDADRIRLFTEGGAAVFANIRIRRITDTYAPYPAAAMEG